GLDFNPAWIKELPINPIPKLLRRSKPSLVVAVLKYLYDLDYTDARYKEAESRVFRQQSWKMVFKRKSSVPTEPGSDQPEAVDSLLFLEQLYRLHRILDLGGSKFLPPVREDIVALMKFQREDGRFPLLYHHHAHACWLLLKTGMEGNRLLDKSIHWIVERQREDGGWLHRSMLPKEKKYDTAPSCIWTTAEILLALSSRKTIAKSETTHKACEFLLDRMLQKNHTNLFPTQEAWDHLSIGHSGDSIFAGGTLKILLSCANCGYTLRDSRMKKAYHWLLALQLDNGFFPRIAGKMPVEDSMVTLQVLQLIRKLRTV
nr:hypothetical protein [FCB group bacterium]